MKVKMTMQIEVETIFEAPLYGFDIGEAYKKIHKNHIKNLVNIAIDREIDYIERYIDGTTFRIKVNSIVKSLNKK